MAETVSLLWPKRIDQPAEIDDGSLRIASVVERLQTLGRAEAPGALARMLDHLDASGRYALLKLATGELRIGVSARLAKTALAQAFGLDVDAVEEVWHGIDPPYLPLFDWAEGRGAQPTAENVPVFRPVHARPPARGSAPVARRLCGGVEMGRDPGPDRPRRRRDPALQPRRRRYQPKLPGDRRELSARTARSTASCWSRASSRAPTPMAARRRASTRSSRGSGASSSRRRC